MDRFTDKFLVFESEVYTEDFSFFKQKKSFVQNIL